MSLFQRGDIWWYEFWFAGRRIRESSKSESKTVAKSAEKNRRRELEEGFNNVSDVRRERVRAMGEIADEFFEEYKLRLPQSATFAEYAIGHIKRLVGDKMLVDMNEASIIKYQNERLTERAAPKTVNEEVGFLLRIMDDLGDLLRVRLKKKKKLKLKVRNDIGKAYRPEEKERMLAAAANARSPHIYLALTLALNAGVRDAELRGLTWAQILFAKGYLVVGPKQDRSRRRAYDSAELFVASGVEGIRSLVPREVWRNSPRMVRLSVWETPSKRSDSPHHYLQNSMAECPQKRQGDWSVAR